jgi:glucans biosynthesis protein
MVDFANAADLPDVKTDPEAVEVRAETSAGTISSTSGVLVESTDNYRAYVKLNPGRADLAELRVSLHVDDKQWGETWIYRWTR